MRNELHPFTHVFSFWTYIPVRGDRLLIKTRRDVEHSLVAAALRSESFRQSLLSDPRRTVEQECGFELPGELQIHILEESEKQVYMVLPQMPPEDCFAALDDPDAMLKVLARAIVHDRRNTLLNCEHTVELCLRVWKDARFRFELLHDPRSVLKAVFSLDLPPEYEIAVIEETPTDVYMVLPALRNSEVTDNIPEATWHQANLGPRYVHVLTVQSAGHKGCIDLNTQICAGVSCMPTIVQV